MGKRSPNLRFTAQCSKNGKIGLFFTLDVVPLEIYRANIIDYGLNFYCRDFEVKGGPVAMLTLTLGVCYRWPFTEDHTLELRALN